MAVTRSRRTPVRAAAKKGVEKDTEGSEESEKGGNVEQSDKVTKATRKSNESRMKCKKPGKKMHQKLQNDVNDIQKSRKQKEETNKQEVKVYTEGGMKGRKMPAYKIEQLERLQRLIDLSSAAKPRGPITQKDPRYKHKFENDTHTEGLGLLLSKSNKNKISNITHYDPERKDFLNEVLDSKKLDAIIERYEKIRKFKDVKAPDLRKDNTLKRVLDEVSAKNENLMFWEAYNDKLQNEEFGNVRYLRNEKRLDRLEISDSQRENLLEQRLHNVLKDDIKQIENTEKVKTEVVNVKKYEKIDIAQETFLTNIENMINIIDKYDANSDEIYNEETIFQGLTVEDYTSERDFKNKRA